MKLQTKILVLLFAIAGVVLLSFFAFQYIRINEKRVLYDENKKNQELIISKILEINRLKYQTLINDNSGWDEMVNFAGNPDLNWAKDNVNFFINSFNLAFVLVYNKDKELIYQFGDSTCLKELQFPDKHTIGVTLTNSPFSRYFSYCGNQLVELFGATIVPASDTDMRITPPMGYLFIGQKWDKDYLAEHAEATGFETVLMTEDELPGLKRENSKEYITKTLHDFEGKTISNLVFSADDPLKNDMAIFKLMSILISLIVSLSILVLLIYFNKIILKPLSLVKDALNSHNKKSIEQLKQLKDEFSVLGELIDNFYKQQKALKNKNKELHELNATKDKLFSIIAHDLRNPVGGIVTISEILPDYIQERNYEAIAEISEIMGLQAKETMSLLETLFDWARSQTGNIAFQPALFEIKQVANNVIKSLTPLATIKNITISETIDPDLMVFADINMVTTVLRNLITNSIKFTNQGGSVCIAANPKKNGTEVIVTDDGIGMDQKTISQLFKIDSNFSTYGTANEKGNGLGLIICKEFVEKHGGRITASSTLGQGSIFSFKLPQSLGE